MDPRAGTGTEEGTAVPPPRRPGPRITTSCRRAKKREGRASTQTQLRRKMLKKCLKRAVVNAAVDEDDVVVEAINVEGGSWYPVWAWVWGKWKWQR
jgi:hypothetical protein